MKYNRRVSRKTNSNKRMRKRQRYTQYYERMMEPLRKKEWENSLKRVRDLKKSINSLGEIPNREVQLLKTVKYFVKFINLVTNFEDKGVLHVVPEHKKDEGIKFNSAIISISGRKEGLLPYHNKTEVGRKVTYNSLYIGIFTPIDSKDVTSLTRTTLIDGKLCRVDMDLTPISSWINKEVETVNGFQPYLVQKEVANTIRKLRDFLLKAIDDVLK